MKFKRKKNYNTRMLSNYFLFMSYPAKLSVPRLGYCFITSLFANLQNDDNKPPDFINIC